MTATPSTVRMIVNADDFGYFDRVSHGILHCARAGVVTATGVMANGPAFDHTVDALADVPSLSTGVHLNATLGLPLTAEMRAELAPTQGQFPSKLAFVARLVSGRISASAVLHEWRAQIDHCVAAGLRPQFLNSHEHVHLLPALHDGVLELARAFGIRHVRAPRPEWGPTWSIGSVARNSAFAAIRLALPPMATSEPSLIGLSASGRLDLGYCRKKFPTLQAATSYELICHPGWADPGGLQNPKLLAYHDWELELRTLTSAEFKALLRENGIALVTYAQLDDDRS